tara:strand:- start:1254 stop:2120 length:867 start_codon:yes stop_codon:yes gene_type:complete
LSEIKEQLSLSLTRRFGLKTDLEIDNLLKKHEFSLESLIELDRILSRKSIRKYSKREINDEIRTLLLACAQSASAKSDLQQYSIIDLSEKTRKESLAKLCDTPWMSSAPMLLVFCGDLRRAARICEMKGYIYSQNTLDSLANSITDSSLAMQSIILAAETVGLGCCCISQVRKRLSETADLLHLPQGVFPLVGLAIGWPDEKRDVSQRLPPRVIIHKNEYSDQNLLDEINEYDRRRHEDRPIARQINTEKYGTKSFYGWSDNTSRRLAEPSELDDLKGFLSSRGFDLS